MSALLEAIREDLVAHDPQAGVFAHHVMLLLGGVLRELAGSSLRQVGEEIRMLRATISDAWCHSAEATAPSALQDLNALHAILDEMLCHFVSHYSNELARARDGFLSVLGHDLRSPLSAITIAGDYLTMPGMLDGKPLQAALGIKNGAASMSAMIRNLMAYADRKSTRLNSSHVKLSYAVFCLKKKVDT